MLTSPHRAMDSLLETNIVDPEFVAVYHDELDETTTIKLDKFKYIQRVLHAADLLIGHNIKFDLSYLLNCGFEYNGSIYDTMVCEYILARGMKRGLSLEDSCKRRDIKMPEKFIMKKYTDEGKNVDQFPLDELAIYCKGDVTASYALAKKQVEILGGTFSDFATHS